MATKKYKTAGDYTVNITKKSKDTVYKFADEDVAKASTLTLNVNNSTYNNFAQNGNDLLVVSQIYDDEGSLSKVVVSTLANFYNYSTEVQPVVFIADDSIYDSMNESNTFDYSVDKTITDKTEGIAVAGNEGKTTYNFTLLGPSRVDRVLDLGGNDVYNIAEGANLTSYGYFPSVYIEDLKGDDKYNLSGEYFDGSEVYFNIRDYKGDDKYTLSKLTNDEEWITIYDEKGDDKYTISDSTYFEMEDIKGDDKYDLSGELYGYITNVQGNDKYNLTEVDSYEGLYISDYKGKDKYTVDKSFGFYVFDVNGSDTYSITSSGYFDLVDYYSKSSNDKYEIKNSYHVGIWDSVGSDTYKFDNVSYLDLEDSTGDDTYKISSLSNYGYSYFAIDDYEGNDKYTIAESNYAKFVDQYGKDTWTVKSSNNLSIQDDEGKDTYKMTRTTATIINDKKGDDKYTASDLSATITINDNEGNDTYKFAESIEMSVTDKKGDDQYTFNKVTNDSDSIISDSEGGDKYTITSSELSIRDYAGNDTYDIKKSIKTSISDSSKTSDDTYKCDAVTGAVTITDEGGKNDKLTISSLKYKNTIIMADFKNDGSGVTDGLIYILDKTKTGHILVDGFFTTTTEEGVTIFAGEGDGYIETVKADSRKINTMIDNFASEANINALASEVAGWLTDNKGYADVNTLLTSGTDDDIKAFLVFVDSLNNGVS